MSNGRYPSSQDPSDRDPSDQDPTDVHELLAELEGLLRDRRRLHVERSSGVRPLPVDDLIEAWDELEQRAAEDPAAASRYAKRMADVRARMALHIRDVPEKALEGLYEDIRAATDSDNPWSRSRMSEAFLDAPDSLARWRFVAMAACAVLALGAGLFVGGRWNFEGGGDADALAREDLRDRTLERFDVAGNLRLPTRPSRGTAKFVSTQPMAPGTQPMAPGDAYPGSPAKRSGLWLFPVGARQDGDGANMGPVGAPADELERN